MIHHLVDSEQFTEERIENEARKDCLPEAYEMEVAEKEEEKARKAKAKEEKIAKDKAMREEKKKNKEEE